MNSIANDTTQVCGLRKVTDDAKTGWINTTTPDGPVVVENPNLNSELVYGIGPAGYDQFLLHVASGSPVLGYRFNDNSELELLALMAGRPNLNDSEHLPEVPGGFAKVDAETGKREFPAKGALRELAEETDLEPDSITPAGGAPFIGDRAFFFKAVDEGNQVYLFELEDTHLAAIKGLPQLQLLPWDEFVFNSVDGITLSSIARVMAALKQAGVLKVTKA